LTGSAKFVQSVGATNNYVLTSDASGVGSWAAIPTVDISGKQDTITASSKLLSSLVDYTSSPLRFVDAGITSNLSTYLTTLDGQNVKLTGTQSIGGNKTFSNSITTVGISNSTSEISSSANISLTGSAKFKQSTGATATYVLTSDATGVGSWAAIPDNQNVKTTGAQSIAGNKTFSTAITTNLICENISSTATFASNVFTCDYESGAIFFLPNSSNTSTGNFTVTVTNVNSYILANKSFTITLIIDSTSKKFYANALNWNGAGQTIKFINGFSSINSTTTTILQSISVIYTTNTTTPSVVMSNIGQFV
jgi:hypothetical protein